MNRIIESMDYTYYDDNDHLNIYYIYICIIVIATILMILSLFLMLHTQVVRISHYSSHMMIHMFIHGICLSQ